MAWLKKTKRWKVICGSVLIATALLGMFVGLKHGFNRPPHPADLIPFWDEPILSPDPADVQQLNEDLKTVTIPEVKFIEKPLVECLNFVLERLNQDGEFDGKVRYRFLVPDETLNMKITLKITNGKAAEVIRYVTSLAQIRFYVEESGEILIAPMHYGQNLRVVTKFAVPTGFSTLRGEGPYDIKNELDDVLLEDDTAEYFPAKGVAIVSTKAHQVFAISSFLESFDKPTIFEKISSKFWGFLNLPEPDPFAAP